MTSTSILRALGMTALAALMQTGAVAQATAPAIIEGTWLTQLKSEITIEPCPDGFCGRISKIVVPQKYIEQYGEQLKEMSAEDYFDYNNKDPALRERPVLNLQILTLKPSHNPFRYEGQIYNPEDGNIYEGYLEVVGADTVRLNGCVLYGLICRGEEWQRVLPAATISNPG